MAFTTEQIRNIVFLGHRGSGKTMLAEAFLFAGGAIDRMGQVDSGTAKTDFEQEEMARKISVTPALCHCPYSGVKINIIDTPGYSEFFADVPYCIKVADTGLLVVDATAGVEIHTIKVYATAVEMGLPVVGMISKMGKEHADFQAAVDSMNESLGNCEAVPVQLPIGAGTNFNGIVDLINMKAYVGQGKGIKAGAIPDDMADAVATAREALIDAVAASDDELTEKYLEQGELSADELSAGLAAAMAQGMIVPVLCSDALQCTGVETMMDFIKNNCLSPDKRDAWEGVAAEGEEAPVQAVASDGPLTGFVFKTLSDPYVGRISLIRVVSGVARSDMQVQNVNKNAKEKLSTLSLLQGKNMQAVSELYAGDIGAVAKLDETSTGDTLGESKQSIVYPCPVTPKPMHSASVHAASRADEDKLSMALARIGEEDMGLEFGRDPESNELIVSGMGALHVDILVERLATKYDATVSLGTPPIPYRETVSRSCRVQGRHKKQTGGRGQFGDVWIRMDPLPGSDGLEFANEVKGGTVPTNFIPAVEKGVFDGLRKGILAGSPVVGVKVTLDDGSSHPVDSSEQAFRMAGSIAVRNALEQAGPTLLEPIMNVAITVAEDIMGDIMSDMSGRRGQIQGSESIGRGLQVVKASVPLAELANYAADLRSLSQGAASYTMEFSHYQEVPAHIAETVIAAAQAKREEEA